MIEEIRPVVAYVTIKEVRMGFKVLSKFSNRIYGT